jgi:hypothetical protein
MKVPSSRGIKKGIRGKKSPKKIQKKKIKNETGKHNA